MEDTVTLALGGSVPLNSFAVALDRLTKVLQQISSDAGARIDWEVTAHPYSSAITTVAGRPLDVASEALLPRVVSDFAQAGDAVAYGSSSTSSLRTLELLGEIAGLVGDEIDEIRFETAEREAVIRAGDQIPATAPKPRPTSDRGTVVGRVQTLQGRGRLRFALYDLTHDRRVSCWLTAGQEELMRGAWGHLVEVEGLVSRDPVTGLPISVRQVTAVRPFDEPLSDAWVKARGAVQAPDAPPAERVIRELRDAW